MQGASIGISRKHGWMFQIFRTTAAGETCAFDHQPSPGKMNEVMFNCSICGPLQFQFMSIHHLLFWGSSELATQVPAEVSNAKCGEDRKCHPTIDVDASFDAEGPGAAAFEWGSSGIAHEGGGRLALLLRAREWHKTVCMPAA